MGNEAAFMKKKRVIAIVFLIIVFIIYSVYFNTYSPKIFIHIIKSLSRMLIGYLLATILGILVSILVGINRYVKMACMPIISFFMSIPTITWVPILLIITGITEKTIIIAVFLGSFFAIMYNTLDGMSNVDQNLIRVGKVLGYNNFQILYKIVIPASFVQILTGLKLGIAYSWRALVGAEMLGATQYGLGYLIFASRKFYDLNRMISTLLIIALLGYLLNRLLVIYLEENTIVKWGIK